MVISKDIDWIIYKTKPCDKEIRVMGWKSLEYKGGWTLIIATIQSIATLGTFIVALVGISRVTPLISYQIERQQDDESTKSILSLLQSEEAADKFVGEALGWLTVQVKNYQHIMDLIKRRDQRNLDVTYDIEESTTQNVPDILVVTAVNVDGKAEMVKVPINSKVMSPTQYIQQKINKGSFSSLDSRKRLKVENSITSYMKAHMQPKVPPPYIRLGMSLQQVYEEISYSQDHRNDTIKHIRALKGVIDEAMVVD